MFLPCSLSPGVLANARLPCVHGTSLEDAVNRRLVQEVGGFSVVRNGKVINPCNRKLILPPWSDALTAAIGHYETTFGKSLVAVNVRGSVPRGLALERISDIDTFAYILPEAATWQAESRWQASHPWASVLTPRAPRGKTPGSDQLSPQDVSLRGAAAALSADFPFATGLEMRALTLGAQAAEYARERLRAACQQASQQTPLNASPSFSSSSFPSLRLHQVFSDGGAGLGLHEELSRAGSGGVADAGTRRPLLSDVPDAFVLATQSICIHGLDLTPLLPPSASVFRPVVAPLLAGRIKDAIQAASSAASTQEADRSLTWALKQCLRAALEVAALKRGPDATGFTRDLFFCCQLAVREWPQAEAHLVSSLLWCIGAGSPEVARSRRECLQVLGALLTREWRQLQPSVADDSALPNQSTSDHPSPWGSQAWKVPARQQQATGARKVLICTERTESTDVPGVTAASAPALLMTGVRASPATSQPPGSSTSPSTLPSPLCQSLSAKDVPDYTQSRRKGVRGDTPCVADAGKCPSVVDARSEDKPSSPKRRAQRPGVARMVTSALDMAQDSARRWQMARLVAATDLEANVVAEELPPVQIFASCSVPSFVWESDQDESKLATWLASIQATAPEILGISMGSKGADSSVDPGPGVPVHIVGGAASWPAARKWDLNFMARQRDFGGRVRISPTMAFTYCEETHARIISGELLAPSITCDMSAAEFALRLQRGDAPGGVASSWQPQLPFFMAPTERYYLQAKLNDNLMRDVNMLSPSVTGILGAAARGAGGGIPVLSQPPFVWLSAAGAVSTLHYDASESFLVQLKGRKRMLLFTPEDLHCLYPYPDDHPLRRRAQVDPCLPDLERFPLFAHASKRALEVVLNPGDVLFFPGYWAHYTESLDLSFSVSFRFKLQKAAENDPEHLL